VELSEQKVSDLREIAFLLSGMILGLAIAVLLIPIASAYTTNATLDINGTITNTTLTFDIPNQTINQTIIQNHTTILNNTIYTNQSVNQSFYYNYTNITCLNCTYVYNQTAYETDFYSRLLKAETRILPLEERVNNLITQVNGINLTSNSTALNEVMDEWRTKDTYFAIAIAIAFLLGLFAFLIVMRSMNE